MKRIDSLSVVLPVVIISLFILAVCWFVISSASNIERRANSPVARSASTGGNRLPERDYSHELSLLLTKQALAKMKSDNLERLDLENFQLTDKVLTRLSELKNLRYLKLPILTNDADLEAIAGLERLEHIELYGRAIRGKGLVHLQGLKNLRHISMPRGTTDDGLAHLAALKEVRNLILYETRITNEGMRHIARFKHLQELNLTRTLITDDGLLHLSFFTNLEMLNLNNTKINGEGLRHLARCKKLHTLSLSDTQVTDNGLRALASIELPHLRHLGLSDNQRVTNAGIVHISRFDTLESLFLYRTNITDDAVESLMKLKKLRLFAAGMSGMTSKGAARLRRRFPNLVIDMGS